MCVNRAWGYHLALCSSAAAGVADVACSTALCRQSNSGLPGASIHWGFRHPQHVANLWCCVHAVMYVSCVHVADRTGHRPSGAGATRTALGGVCFLCPGGVECSVAPHRIIVLSLSVRQPCLKPEAAGLQCHPCVLTVAPALPGRHGSQSLWEPLGRRAPAAGMCSFLSWPCHLGNRPGRAWVVLGVCFRQCVPPSSP